MLYRKTYHPKGYKKKKRTFLASTLFGVDEYHTIGISGVRERPYLCSGFQKQKRFID